ncbi:MAG: hypothetical protein COB40_09320 [Marinosulfonomonas sp.]|nr:MAG: hypothetical protein COB40_09320 [Marinosulfonomonas sp.]
MSSPEMKNSELNQNNISRRKALARLGLMAATVYVAPSFLTLSSARASSSVSPPSGASIPTPPTPPTAPSNVDELEFDVVARDRCGTDEMDSSGGPVTIGQNDMKRAQEAVEAGYAKPLDQVWPGLMAAYSGRIIRVEFTGFRWRPRYRLRAISETGHLETVIVSARTGRIERIVGC